MQVLKWFHLWFFFSLRAVNLWSFLIFAVALIFSFILSGFGFDIVYNASPVFKIFSLMLPFFHMGKVRLIKSNCSSHFPFFFLVLHLYNDPSPPLFFWGFHWVEWKKKNHLIVLLQNFNFVQIFFNRKD